LLPLTEPAGRRTRALESLPGKVVVFVPVDGSHGTTPDDLAGRLVVGAHGTVTDRQKLQAEW